MARADALRGARPRPPAENTVHCALAYKLDPTALRVVQSYGSFLSRQGNTAEALKVFATFDEALPRHPLIVEATNELKAGKKLPLMVDTPQAGAAEVLYGLGAALGRLGGEDLGLIYLLAFTLSRALASARPAVARRPVRGDEEAGIRQQSL